jgi:GNAT superfamily N-acetyltransferase
MTVDVRTATREDAPDIASVRVRTWLAAYDGLIDPLLLERMDIEREGRRRAERWSEYTADPANRQFVATLDGETIGWAAVGVCRDSDGRGRGELYALYVLPEHWSTGVGHALMAASERSLRRSGYTTASLWVLDGNERAAGFYERHGWREDGFVKDDDRIIGDMNIAALRERRRIRDLSEIPAR